MVGSFQFVNSKPTVTVCFAGTVRELLQEVLLTFDPRSEHNKASVWEPQSDHTEHIEKRFQGKTNNLVDRRSKEGCMIMIGELLRPVGYEFLALSSTHKLLMNAAGLRHLR